MSKTKRVTAINTSVGADERQSLMLKPLQIIAEVYILRNLQASCNLFILLSGSGKWGVEDG